MLVWLSDLDSKVAVWDKKGHGLNHQVKVSIFPKVPRKKSFLSDPFRWDLCVFGDFFQAASFSWSGLGPPMILMVVWLFDLSLLYFSTCDGCLMHHQNWWPIHLKTNPSEIQMLFDVFYSTSLRFLQSLCNHRVGYQQRNRRLHPRNETKNQWDFQGAPRTWEPLMVSGTHIIAISLYRDSGSEIIWVTPCPLGPWNHPWKNVVKTHPQHGSAEVRHSYRGGGDLLLSLFAVAWPGKSLTRWWQLKYFLIFIPIWGKMNPILTSIFFRWVGSTTN